MTFVSKSKASESGKSGAHQPYTAYLTEERETAPHLSFEFGNVHQRRRVFKAAEGIELR